MIGFHPVQILAVIVVAVCLLVHAVKYSTINDQKDYSGDEHGEIGRSVDWTVQSSRSTVKDISNIKRTQLSCNIPKFIDSSWEIAPLYPISAAEPHGQIVGNDLVILGGFFNSFKNTTNQTYARTVTVNNSRWRRMDDVRHPIGITHTPTVVIGNRVFMCGGYIGGSPGPHTSTCFIYNHGKLPGTRQWSKFQRLPQSGTGGAGLIYDDVTNALYYVGGAQRPYPGILISVDVNKVWRYSFRNTSLGWVESTPMPYMGNHLSYVTAKDDSGNSRHFILGGQIGEDERLSNLADMVEFVPQGETWIRRASMPFGRSHATASVRAIGCGFIVAGGAINSCSATSQKQQTAVVAYYNIPTDNWTTIGNLREAIVTPIVDIDREGYMHFLNTRARTAYRRRIAV